MTLPMFLRALPAAALALALAPVFPTAQAQTASPALVTPADQPATLPESVTEPEGTRSPRSTRPTSRSPAGTAASTPAGPATTPAPATPPRAVEAPVAPPRSTRSSSTKSPRSQAAGVCQTGPSGRPYAQRPEVQAFAAALADKAPELDADAILRSLGQACFQPDVTRLIMPAATPQARNWRAYRARFVESQRIAAGLAFWKTHQRWLAAAETRYGVPADVIVGILGVETYYGKLQGGFRVLDALATLAFDFPSGRSDRSGFFREQLEALLRLARREAIDPASIKGSYAGAIGWAQFMPGSWLQYAVDFNGDSRIDLRESLPDVIGSVAAFLAAHGWQQGLPARYHVEPPADPDQLATLLANDIRPTLTREDFDYGGARLDAAGRDYTGLMALVELLNGDAAPSYVAGTENFWALTRYNWSAYYAMAVLDLGEAIAARRGPTSSGGESLDDETAPRPRKSAAKAKVKARTANP